MLRSYLYPPNNHPRKGDDSMISFARVVTTMVMTVVMVTDQTDDRKMMMRRERGE